MRVERGRRLGILDGLRGLALAAVVAYHVAPSTLRGGFLGVEVFFVLSGFLLTSLLLEEVVRKRFIDRKAYAIRRLGRIGPALILLLLAVVIVAPRLAPDDAYRLGGDIISSLTGMTNWHLIRDGNSYFTRLGRPPLVRHLWSVAVEVQFYLVCPFIVGWVVWRRRLTAISLLLAGIAASAGVMALLYQSPDPSRAYYGTDTRVGALLSGVLLAFLLGSRSRSAEPASTTRFGSARWAHLGGLAGLAALAVLLLVTDERARWLYPLGFLATQAATMLVIAGALRGGALGRILQKRSLTWLGKRSYGIYLWHWPAVSLLRPGMDVSWPPWLAGAVSIVVAVVLGALSFRLVERPYMKTRPAHAKGFSFSYRVLRPALAVLALIPLVGLVFQLPTVDPIAASLRAGQRVVASQEAPQPQERVSFVLSGAEAPLVSAPGPIPAVAQVVPSAPNPPPQAPLMVTAIGDSVMVGAAGALQSKLGPTGFIDARLGRQFNEEVQVVRDLREQGRLGSVVVAHFGNNGPVKARQVDALMAELAAVRHVILVTVRVDRPWQDSVNRTYFEAAQRHPKVKIADWNAHSAAHPEWFASDGTHLRPKGAEAYAALIVSSLPPATEPSPAPPPPVPAPPLVQPPSLPVPFPPLGGTAPFPPVITTTVNPA